MKIIYEPIKNLNYLFLLDNLLKAHKKLFEHHINFNLTPVDNMYQPNIKIIY